MQIYITRYGQTVWNLEGRKQGRSDVPLNQTGIAEAKKLQKVIELLAIDLCYTSPLQRAMQTATIAVGKKCQIIPDQRLIERSFGDYEGQIISFKNGDLGVNIDDLNAETLPGGIETPRQMIVRAENFLRELKQKMPSESKILLIIHGSIAKAFIFCLEHKSKFENIKHLGNCELIKYQI